MSRQRLSIMMMAFLKTKRCTEAGSMKKWHFTHRQSSESSIFGENVAWQSKQVCPELPNLHYAETALWKQPLSCRIGQKRTFCRKSSESSTAAERGCWGLCLPAILLKGVQNKATRWRPWINQCRSKTVLIACVSYSEVSQTFHQDDGTPENEEMHWSW